MDYVEKHHQAGDVAKKVVKESRELIKENMKNDRILQ